jgi:hypothetical protein
MMKGQGQSAKLTVLEDSSVGALTDLNRRRGVCPSDHDNLTNGLRYDTAPVLGGALIELFVKTEAASSTWPRSHR